MLEQTKKMGEDSLERATKAYDEALGIYTEARGLTLPNVTVSKMVEDAEEITDEVRLEQALVVWLILNAALAF